MLRSIVRMNLLSVNCEDGKRNSCYFLLLYLKLYKLWPQCVKYLAKMEKALNLQVEDMPIDGNVLHLKAQSLQENINKEFPKTNDTKSFTASKG